MSIKEYADGFTEYMLDYSAKLDGYDTPPELFDLEIEMHEGPEPRDPTNPLGLHGWALNHEERFPEFSSLDFQPKKYRWQQLTINKIPASAWLYVLPRKMLVPKMRRKFIETIGPRASVALDAYDNTPADSENPIENGGLSVAQKIGEILLENKSVLVAVSHANNIDDVGVNQGPVALAAAAKRTRLIRKVGTNLSKTLTRERYKGKPVPHFFKFFGNIYLTIPDTTSLPEWRIPVDATKFVIGGGLRAMMRDIDGGAAIVMAPTGSAMKQNPQTEHSVKPIGPKSLFMPAFSDNSSRIIEKFDYFMAAASWGDNVSISSIYALPEWKKLEQEKGRRLSKVEKTGIMVVYLNLIRSELAQHTANAAQIPVTFDLIPKSGEDFAKKTALPKQN